jgi:hypothetical protein
MDSINVSDAVEAVYQHNAVVVDNAIDVDVLTADVAPIQITSEEFVLSSGGMYAGNGLIGAVPTWILNAIQQELTTGSGSIMSVLTGLQTVLDTLQVGVTQSITSLNTTTLSQSGLITRLRSDVNNNNASIINVLATKVTATEAQAVALDAIQSKFGTDVSAFVGNIASTYVDANSAIAQDVDLMSVEMNGMSVAIEETKNLLIASYSEWTGTGDPAVGEFYKFGATWYQYIGGTFGPNADGWVPTSVAQGLSYVDNTVGAELTAFATTVDGLLADIQNQIDGTIATYFRDGEPTLLNLPASDWTTVEDKSLHVGDLYYDRLTGYGYRFAYEDIDDTPDAGVIYSWIRITDVDVVLALSNAAKAQDTADGKRAVFYKNTIPVGEAGANGNMVPLETGDIWIPSGVVTGHPEYVVGEVYVYVEGGNPLWVTSTRYTAAVAAVQNDLNGWRTGTYATFVTEIQGQVDKKSETFYQDTVPAGRTTSLNVAVSTTLDAYVGDLWKNTYVGTVSTYLGNNTEYVYTKTANGSNWDYRWTEMAIPNIVFDELDTKKSIYTGDALPVAVAPDVIQANDMWITGDAPVGGHEAKSIYIWSGSAWVLPVKYTDDTAANRVVKIFSQVISPAPTAEGIGDFWKVTDRWYTNDTGTTVSTSNTKKGYLIKRWSGFTWVDIAREDIGKYNDLSWVGSASSLITGTTGEITGWQYADGSHINSEFTINADKFKLVATSQGAASKNPFTVDATTGDITFVGKVSFNSVTDAPDMVAANTNINVSTNLVPNAGWNVGGHGDYQFFGTPLYYRMLGAGTVAEDTLLLNVGDEIYTPYIEDMTLSYKLSYSFKGAKIGSFITVVGTTPTSVAIIPAGVTVDAAKWYNVQIAVLPNGTTGSSLFGFIQEAATLNIVSAINDVVLGATVEKLLMGFVATADTYISRVGIETITASTLSSVPVTASNVNTVLASTNTVIDGGRITTGYISANRIDAGTITSSKLSTNIALIDGSAYSAGFPYPSGAITGTPAGFRLSSNAAGTSADPTIYGAYIKGSKLEASDVVITTSAGLTTRSIVSSASTIVTHTQFQHYTFSYELYAPVSPTSSNRVATTDRKYLAFGATSRTVYWDDDTTATNNAATVSYSGWVVIGEFPVVNLASDVLTVTINGVSLSMSPGSGGLYTVNGINFYIHRYNGQLSGIQYTLFMQPVGTVPTTWNTDKLTIILYLNHSGLNVQNNTITVMNLG